MKGASTSLGTRERGHRRGWVLGGILMSAGTVVVLLVMAMIGGGTTPRQELGPDMSDMPLGPGVPVVTLATADSEAGFHVYRPHWGTMTDDDVVRVWARAGASEVALLYESGVMAFVSHAQVREPRAFFETQQADGVEGQVVRVGGGVASLVPTSDTSRGALDLFVNGIEIQVIAPTGGNLSLNDLGQIANSVS